MTYTLINANGTEQARYEHEALIESIRDLHTVEERVLALVNLEYGALEDEGVFDGFELSEIAHGYSVSNVLGEHVCSVKVTS